MKKLFSVYLFSFLVIALLSLAASDAQAQCAMCRSSVESNSKSKENPQMGLTLNSGILYLMTIPYILVGTVGFIWYRQTRKNK